jgi:hypothetical protein
MGACQQFQAACEGNNQKPRWLLPTDEEPCVPNPSKKRALHDNSEACATQDEAKEDEA